MPSESCWGAPPLREPSECASSEVGLITIEARIKEVAVSQLTRSLDAEDDKFSHKVFTQPSTKKERNHRWLRAARHLYNGINLHDFTHDNKLKAKAVAPWATPHLHTLLPDPSERNVKANITDAELRQRFLSRIDTLPSDTVYVYTDGSVGVDGRAGCGVVIEPRGALLR